MIKKALLASLVIVILICVGGAIFLYSAVNRDIDEHFAGQCTEFDLDGSGEDMQMDAERGFYTSPFLTAGRQPEVKLRDREAFNV